MLSRCGPTGTLQQFQSTERSGNTQLTWNDANHYDYGMRMGRLTLDQEGNRFLPEATRAEREHMRRYNWLFGEGHATTVKVDLAAVWDQICRLPGNREVERTIPQIHLAEGTEIIKLLLGLQHIVAHEAVVLVQAVQARELTYGEWYQNQLATVTLPTATLLTSFGTDVFQLNRTQVKKLTETLERMTVSEVLALALALGPTKFVAGPLDSG